MSDPQKKNYFFDNPRNVKKFIYLFFVLCAIVICIDLFLHRHLSFAENTFPLESRFGFYAIYGFVACVLLVVVATQLRKLLMRKEDYYDA